ncbi:hypothetical protein ACPDHJ_12580 [Myroides sp. C8-3]
MAKKLNKINLSKEDQGLLLLMQQAVRDKVVSRNEIMKVLSENKK